jgi:hypothetical protein
MTDGGTGLFNELLKQAANSLHMKHLRHPRRRARVKEPRAERTLEPWDPFRSERPWDTVRKNQSPFPPIPYWTKVQ